MSENEITTAGDTTTEKRAETNKIRRNELPEATYTIF